MSLEGVRLYMSLVAFVLSMSLAAVWLSISLEAVWLSMSLEIEWLSMSLANVLLPCHLGLYGCRCYLELYDCPCHWQPYGCPCHLQLHGCPCHILLPTVFFVSCLVWEILILAWWAASFIIEPTHEILALFVCFLVWPFVYFHSSYVRTANALARLRGYAGSPEHSLVAYVISTIISWAGSIKHFIQFFMLRCVLTKTFCNRLHILRHVLLEGFLVFRQTNLVNSVVPDQSAVLSVAKMFSISLSYFGIITVRLNLTNNSLDL